MIRRELTFLTALWKANLLAAMEYRAAFISQIIGMILNNAVYFLIWVIYFDRFKQVRGWGLNDMFLLYGIVAGGWGLGVVLFGNVSTLSEVIASGRLDYYLSLPRPVLLHVLASHTRGSGLGDFAYGVLSFFLARQFSGPTLLRFLLGLILSMLIFLSFQVLVHSLSFWLGNSQMISAQATNALLTFSLYPFSLFDGGARLFLFTLIPAALVGAVPAEMVASFSWRSLGQIFLAALIFLAASVFIFYRGLRRYESGSAIQAQL